MAFFGGHDPHNHGHHDPHRQPHQQMMHGRGEMVNFAFKQVSLFHNDKHVHVLMWLDGHPVHANGHGMGEVSVQMMPGRHHIDIAVYNPDAVFDARHPSMPESTAEFTLDEHKSGLLNSLFGHGHERHVVIEYSVSQNLLTKSATATIRKIRTLR